MSKECNKLRPIIDYTTSKYDFPICDNKHSTEIVYKRNE